MRFPKRQRVKLTGEAFKQWKLKVLTRDGWRCRRCGSRQNLSCHHIQKRSDLRLDTLENGCTLCNDCHEMVEGKVPGKRVIIVGNNANLRSLGFRWAEEQ